MILWSDLLIVQNILYLHLISHPGETLIHVRRTPGWGAHQGETLTQVRRSPLWDAHQGETLTQAQVRRSSRWDALTRSPRWDAHMDLFFSGKLLLDITPVQLDLFFKSIDLSLQRRILRKEVWVFLRDFRLAFIFQSASSFLAPLSDTPVSSPQGIWYTWLLEIWSGAPMQQWLM